jgi:hypothetical protein
LWLRVVVVVAQAVEQVAAVEQVGIELDRHNQLAPEAITRLL